MSPAGLIDIPPGFELVEPYDADSGVIAVPNTGVYTQLVGYTPGGPFWLSSVKVHVYDPAVVPILEWEIRINGQTVAPWQNQRMLSTELAVSADIGRIISSVGFIQLVARIPATSPVGFDVVGRIRGALLRRNAGR